MNELPEAGVGMIYLPGLENLLESHLKVLDVIEIEPQTLWYNKNPDCDSFQFNQQQTLRLQQYDREILFHSVGMPVAGSILPRAEDIHLLTQHAAQLNPLWLSEHLSFNTIAENSLLVNTNFLLPPLQSREGIATAVKGIQHFRLHTRLPFAFETGTNYLQPHPGELNDGYFVAEIAAQADCSILLDLHNIMANAINGRQAIADYINELPLERVSEIHLAGGFVHNGYYLDGHSGVSSKELFDIAAAVIRKLPHLKALIFEMLPDYIDTVSFKNLRLQFEKMRRLWDSRGKDHSLQKKPERNDLVNEHPIYPTGYSVNEWELTLGKAAIAQPMPSTALAELIQADKGIPIINELIFHFRASMIVATLPLTTRLLRMQLGKAVFNEDVKRFLAQTVPGVFAFAVAKQYAQYLSDQHYSLPYLYKTMEYELASLCTITDNIPRSVTFDFNPFPVLRALTEGRLPGEQDTPMSFILDIQPDAAITQTDAMNYMSVFHN